MAGPAAEEPMLGTLDPAWRVVGSSPRDDEFWRFLAAVSLLYVLLGALLLPTFDRSVVEEARRRGQVDDPTSVSIELVEAPDEPANARHDQSGLEQPAQPAQATPTVAPPQTAAPPMPPPQVTPPEPAPAEPAPDSPQPAQRANPRTEPVAPLRPTQPLEDAASPRDAPQDAPQMRPEASDQALADEIGVDLTMRDYAAALDAEVARRKREQEARRAAPPPPPTASLSSSSRLRGSPSSGRSDAYSRSVIAALLRAKPPPFALRGSVMVSFEISQSGGLVYVRMLDSSGNKAMDAEAVAAIRRARFEPPPPGKSRADLTYIINFIFD